MCKNEEYALDKMEEAIVAKEEGVVEEEKASVSTNNDTTCSKTDQEDATSNCIGEATAAETSQDVIKSENGKEDDVEVTEMVENEPPSI